jgi:hypothetical protein
MLFVVRIPLGIVKAMQYVNPFLCDAVFTGDECVAFFAVSAVVGVGGTVFEAGFEFTHVEFPPLLREFLIEAFASPISEKSGVFEPRNWAAGVVIEQLACVNSFDWLICSRYGRGMKSVKAKIKSRATLVRRYSAFVENAKRPGYTLSPALPRP